MEQMVRSIGSLLLDPKYSDLEIRCEGRSYHVHRAIVCSRSVVFAQECDGAFKEASDGVIEHSLFGALTVEQMLQFIYTGDYSVLSAHAAGETEIACTDTQALVLIKDGDAHCPEQRANTTIAALAHVHVYGIALYYNIADLAKIACQKFSDLDAAVDVDRFADVLEAVYQVTAEKHDELRVLTYYTALRHINELIGSEAFMEALAERSILQDFVAQYLYMVATTTRRDEGSAHPDIVDAKPSEIETVHRELRTAHLQRSKLIERFENQGAELKIAKQGLDMQQTAMASQQEELSSLRRHMKKLQRDRQEESERYSRELDLKRSEITTLQSRSESMSKEVETVRRDCEAAKTAAEISNISCTNAKEKASAETDKAKKYHASYQAAVKSTAAAEIRVQRMKSERDAAMLETTAVRTQLSQATARPAGEHSRGRRAALEEVVNLVDRWDECRNCHQDLDVWMEWDDRYGGDHLMLRCLECRARHHYCA